MANDDIQLDITVNDDGLIRALNNMDKRLSAIEKDAGKIGNSMSDSLKKADNSAEQLNAELKKVSQNLERAEKSGQGVGRGLLSNVRGLRSELRLFNTLPNVFGIAVSAIGKARDAINFFNETFNSTALVTKAVGEATADLTQEFIKERGQLNDLVAVVQDETRSKKDRQLAIDALKNQFPDYFQNLTLENAKTGEIAIGYEKATKSINDNLKAKIRAQIIEKQLADAVTKQLEAEQAQRQANLVQQSGAFGNVLLTQYSQISSNLAQTRAATAKAGAQDFTAVDAALESIFATLESVAGDAKGVTDTTTAGLKELAGQTESAGTRAKEAAEKNTILAGSIADIEKKLAAVNEQIKQQTAAGDVTALTPLIAQAESLEKQLKAANEQIDKLRTPKETERKSDTGAEEAQLTADEVTKIRTQAFEQAIALNEALLRQTQAAELLRLKTAGATEEQITEEQEAQEQERQRLALETEKKRLEFLLKYGDLRTQAEIETTQAGIAAVTDELKALGIKAEEAVKVGGKKRRSFYDLLGLDPETEEGSAAIAGIQKGVSMAIEGLQNLFAQQQQIAEAEIALRNENISQLQTDLANELKLNEQGFASNVALKKKELAEEQAAREEAIRQQKKAQQAQLIIDTVTQAANLITASTEIFQSFAALPFGIGIPIAAGVVAAMIGSFIASKALAFKATKFSEGGQLPAVGAGGRSDKGNGRGHRVEDTNIVVGGGEYITKAEVTAEHLPFLEKMNSGEYKGQDLIAAVEGKKSRIRIMQKSSERAVLLQQQRNDQVLTSAIETQTLRLEKQLKTLNKKPSFVTFPDGSMMEILIDGNGKRIVHKTKKR